jgi:hypothetical protein
MTGNGRDRAGWGGSRWRIAVWGGAALVLLVPLVAMRFTCEVVWGPLDFAVFGAMLAAACGSFELAARATGNRAYRGAVGVGVGAAFLLVWINLAVGILGDEGDPANLTFFGVLAVGAAGAFVARFRPRGMARALVLTALAQALAGAIALIGGLGAEAVLLSGFFAALWLTSAWLFQRAARRRSPAGTAR